MPRVRSYTVPMIELILYTALTLGLSESIEGRLPTDPGMIYTVSFDYQGTKVGVDWKNRAVVAHRVCRKTNTNGKLSCQQAALRWLQEECSFYGAKKRLNGKQQDMQAAVCNGADDLQEMLKARL